MLQNLGRFIGRISQCTMAADMINYQITRIPVGSLLAYIQFGLIPPIKMVISR